VLTVLGVGRRLAGEAAPDVLVLLDPALGSAACAAVAAFSRSALHATYLALVFTRSAALRLPAQRAALLVVAFAKGAEQLLRRRGGGQVAEPRVSRQARLPPTIRPPRRLTASRPTNQLCTKPCLLTRCMSGVAQPSRFEVDTSVEDMRIALAVLHTLHTLMPYTTSAPPALAAQLLGPTPGACMTEAGDEGVDSACQLLVLLCVADELAPLFEATPQATAQRGKVAMALLAEAVSRSCRVLLRSSPPPPDTLEARSGQSEMMLTARELVRKALGITAISCHDVCADDVDEPPSLVHSGEYDVGCAVRHSGGFFLKAFTNATPFAVVACVGVAEVTREWLAREAPGASLRSVLADASASSALAVTLAAAFESKRVSMRRFLEDHLPGAGPTPHAQCTICAMTTL
jgi:hypothetical protein